MLIKVEHPIFLVDKTRGLVDQKKEMGSSSDLMKTISFELLLKIDLSF